MFHRRVEKEISNQRLDQDPRIRSKCSTPKRTDYFKNNRQAQLHKLGANHNNSSSILNQRTQTKQVNAVDNDMHLRMSNSFIKDRSKDQDRRRDEFEREINKKVSSYNVVAGTLREYFKQTKSKDKNKNKSEMLNTAIQIIKAFSKTQITSVSPGVNELIINMLDTLPMNKHKPNKKNSRSNKISSSNLNLGTKQKIKENSNHTRQSHQLSFSNRRNQEKNLKMQISQLQANLFDLRRQNQILEQIRSEFQDMDEDDKQEYIQQLEQIVTNQQKLLQKLGGLD